MSKVETECSSCVGTGVYCGFAEAKGEAVVCLTCDGTGCHIMKYTPFTGLKRRSDVSTVRRSRGTFIATGVGACGGSVSYEEFVKGRRP